VGEIGLEAFRLQPVGKRLGHSHFVFDNQDPHSTGRYQMVVKCLRGLSAALRFFSASVSDVLCEVDRRPSPEES
jgi:hypothetical protein